MIHKMIAPHAIITKINWVFHLSKHLSYVKRRHILVSLVKLIFCGLSRLYKIEASCLEQSSVRKQKVNATVTPLVCVRKVPGLNLPEHSIS
jgi:hypothetical protein